MRRFALLLSLAASTWLTASAHPEIEEALARLNALLAAAPGDAALYLQRGQLYAQHEDRVSAEANYLVAAEIAPNLPGLATARGALALANGEWAAARRLLDAVLEKNPRDAEALVLRSRASAGLKNKRAALADLDTALALLPQPPPDLFLARAALLPTAQAAIDSLDAGLARLGPVPALLEQALALEESAGLFEAALARVDGIIAQSERPEQWLKRRGDLLRQAGRPSEAEEAYATARERIHRLPSWLQQSPATTRLLAELNSQPSHPPFPP